MAVGTAVLPRNPGSAIVQNLISGSISANTTSNVIAGCDFYSALNLHIKVASIAGTSPTFNIYLQQLAADGTTWYDIASMSQITGNGDFIMGIVSAGSTNFTATDATLTANTIKTVPFGRQQRVKLVKGGTNPSATITLGIEYLE